ncbi:hypothetical protein [Enterobacter hormaechei]
MEKIFSCVNGKIRITLWASFIAYGILNAIIYSWFFWRKFNVNIMHFATISDLIPFIVYAMAVPILLIFITFLFLSVWELVIGHVFPKIGVLAQRYNINSICIPLVKCLITLSFVFGLLCTIFLIYPGYNLEVMLNDESGWIKGLIGFSSAILGGVLSRVTTFLPEVHKLRSIIFCLFLAIPGLTYAFADDQAGFIIKGINTFIITSKVDCEPRQGETFRYISTISDKTFALSLLDGSVCIYKYSHLRLQKEDNIHYSPIPTLKVTNRM